MSKHSNVDGLGIYTEPKVMSESSQKMLEESLFDATCESISDEELDEYMDNHDIEKTDRNIEKAIREIAFDKLGWDH